MADGWEDAPGGWEDAPQRKLSRAEIRRAIDADAITRGALDPTSGMSGAQTFAAGAGKFVADVGRGVAQMTPWGPSRRDIEDVRDRDNPLMAKPAGFLGNIGGGALAMIPMSFIPGANTVGGATLAGGVMGGVQPVGEGDSRLLNTIVGAGTGGLLKVGLDKLGSWLSNRATQKAAELQAQRLNNAGRDAAIEEARRAGYRLTPHQAEAGPIAKAVEGISGSAKMEKSASVANQKVTNALAREEIDKGLQSLGLSGLGSRPLSAQTMDDVISEAVKTGYKSVDGLKSINWDPKFDRSVKLLSMKSTGGAVKHPAEEAIDDLINRLVSNPQWTGRELRADVTRLRELSSTNFAAARRAGGDVEKTALARAQSHAAGLLEDLAERNLANNNAPANVISDFKESRQLIAKAFSVKDALDGMGNVSARDLANSGSYLTGGLRQAADFARRFEGSARDISSMRDRASLSAFDYAAGLGGAMFDPTFGALALTRPAMRGVTLSNIGQSLMANPNYNVPLSTRAASQIANNPMVNRYLPLAAVPGVLSVTE